HRAVLGSVAVRDADPAAPPCRPPWLAGPGAARRPRRDADPPGSPLRRAVRRAVPLLDGLARGADRAGRRRRRDGRVAAPRPRLSAACRLRDGPEVHGWVRAARRPPARPAP